MTHPFPAALLGFTLLFSACTKPAPEAAKKSAPVEASQPKPSSDCVRGEPEALLASQSEFQKSSPAEAQETVRLDSPIKLVIRHYGCAHYALDFEFSWPDPQMPAPDVSLNLAAGLLENLPYKEANRQAMKNLVEAIRKMAKEPYKQPLTMSENETLTATTPKLNVLRIRYDVTL